MPVEDDRIPAVIAALRQAHPYEEPAYDIYPVDGTRSATGMGALGTLAHSMTASAFVRHVKRQLNAPGVRHAGLTAKKIRTVAVCGGAGGDMLGAAIGAGADAFVTADVNYHTFLEATGRILLIDAGHFETEHPVVGHVGKFLRSSLSDDHPDVTIIASAVRTSTVVFV
jgi:putative NIF3 family GTP cyclohydrolase 1 type 2